MALIKSISGIRGTIGGKVSTNLTPIDTVKFAAAYGMWLKAQTSKKELNLYSQKGKNNTINRIFNKLNK